MRTIQTVNNIARQSVEKTERENDRGTGGFYCEKNVRTNIREKHQTKCYRDIIPLD